LGTERGIATRIDHRRGYTLIEVLVALAILLAGVLAIVMFFPRTLSASAEAVLVTEAAVLAQMKAEEIRRDDDVQGSLVKAISQRTTPTDGIPFVQEPNLAYSFSGRTVLYPADQPNDGDPRNDDGVARVLIRYAKSYRSTEDVIYELRFGF
jgi:prepilin-type N-terminal cleavage/methylation domain-containing protein